MSETIPVSLPSWSFHSDPSNAAHAAVDSTWDGQRHQVKDPLTVRTSGRSDRGDRAAPRAVAGGMQRTEPWGCGGRRGPVQEDTGFPAGNITLQVSGISGAERPASRQVEINC